MKKHGTDSPLVCYICTGTFVNNGDLKVHLKTHLSDLPYKCYICKEIHLSSAKFKEHLISHVDIEQGDATLIYECSECGQGMPTVKLLVHHMSTHQTDKIHKCNKCGRKFPFMSFYEAHVCRLPHECVACKERFSTKLRLKNHTMDSHPEEYDKLWDNSNSCIDCGVNYKQLADLERHTCKSGDYYLRPT